MSTRRNLTNPRPRTPRLPATLSEAPAASPQSGRQDLLTMAAGWTTVAICLLHTLVFAVHPYWADWLAGPLREGAFTADEAAQFWGLPGGFVVPGAILGLLIIRLGRRGQMLPGYVGWVLAHAHHALAGIAARERLLLLDAHPHTVAAGSPGAAPTMAVMSALEAYSARAQEYADLLGSVEAMTVQDRHRIESWAEQVHGPLLDLGCGPGHWTAHLASRGHAAQGWDPVPEFLEIARRAHPGVGYRIGSDADLAQQPGAWGGILAWYSLIHLAPDRIPTVLEELRHALRPRGHLLLGFFDGPRQEEFDHAVAPAQHWPAVRMAHLVEQAGFEVIDLETRQDPGTRPHAALHARRP